VLDFLRAGKLGSDQRAARMFEWIEFQNYKALRKTNLPLSRFTLIVGANGSGKSTALNAITALANPRRWPADDIRTAGVPASESVHLMAKWVEDKGAYRFTSQWTPEGNGPLIKPTLSVDKRWDSPNGLPLRFSAHAFTPSMPLPSQSKSIFVLRLNWRQAAGILPESSTGCAMKNRDDLKLSMRS